MPLPNEFYTPFDLETMEPASPLDYRTPFQRERDRIIHSSAFRRLQAKTQVFMSGQYDFYRTRLTHSMEVAQIGRSICYFLRKSSPYLNDEFFIDADLVEAVCLAHDLGHPPFGHSGERTLNRLMRHSGGFEGNAQTLRMLTEIFYSDSHRRRGMNPTRALLDGVMKYKVLYGELNHPENHFLYNEQARFLQFIFADTDYPRWFSNVEERNRFRSIECQIMDWADDTAYSLNDIVDGIHAGFITRQTLERWAEEQSLSRSESRWLDALLSSMVRGTVERDFARKIGAFIRACQLEEDPNPMTGKTHRYRFRLAVDSDVREEAQFYQRVAVELVFRAPQLHQLDYKWNFILERLFRALKENYLSAKPLKLLPVETDTILRREKNPNQRLRLICDHIAGMTDGFAIRTFKRLFDPDFGSIVDLV